MNDTTERAASSRESLQRLAGPIQETSHRYAAAVFTGDLPELAASMPSPRLHPIQVARGRGLVLFEATQASWTRAGEPLFDVEQILVATAVSIGDSPAKPLAPLGELFDDSGEASEKAGFLVLQVLVSNPVAADFFRDEVGYQGVVVADVTGGTTDRAEWFAAAVAGTSAVGLAVRNTGKSNGGSGAATLLAMRDGQVVAGRSTVGGQDQRFSMGKKSASVRIGPHPAGELVRLLQPGRALGGIVSSDHEAVMEALPQPLPLA